MKNLRELLGELSYECVQGTLDVPVEEIANDSRKAGKGSLFFCIKGAASDGHRFAAQAAGQGARVLVVSDPVEVPADVTVIRVADTRYAMALISAAWYGYPARQLAVIGITGT